MGPALSSKAPVSRCIDGLASEDPAVVAAAKEVLAARGHEAVPALIAALDADPDELRLRAISLLSLVGDSRAAHALAALLHDGSSRIRQHAAGALASIPAASTVPSLLRLLQREETVNVRHVAVRSLVRLLRAGRDEAVQPLLVIVSNEDEHARVRLAALDALPWIAPGETVGDAAARRLLERLARDREPRVAARARRLIEHPPRIRLEPAAIEHLIADVSSRTLATWRRAVSLLVAAGGPVVEPLVQAMLASPRDAEFARRCGLALKGLSARQLGAVGPYLDVATAPVVLEVLVSVAAEAGGRPLLASIAGLVDRLAEAGATADRSFDRARARAHLALARNGSRIAAADLRRMLGASDTALMPSLAEAAGLIGTRDDLPAMLRAYLSHCGMTRLRLREAAVAITRRERVRRNDRWVASLGERERRAVYEILGAPRPRRKGPRLRVADVDTREHSLLT